MSDTPKLEELAGNILRAAGSSLKNYTMPATRKAILDATKAAILAGRKGFVNIPASDLTDAELLAIFAGESIA